MVTLPEAELRVSSHDVSLQRRLVNFLANREVPERDSLHLEVHGGTVVVRGKLRSDRAKSLCLECCRHVAGVIKLVDEVLVESTKLTQQAESRREKAGRPRQTRRRLSSIG